MNRLRVLLIGAALITGGSAFAQAQTYQPVAYHDEHRDDRRFDNRYRDDHRAYRDARFDNDRRFNDRRVEVGARRWDGNRWQHWDGYRWCY
jgi:hypothetical protein